MKYFVYMLLTEHGTIYTGIAKNPEERFKKHLKGKKAGGAKYTNANKPVKLLYQKQFETKSLALKEECRIKKLSHSEKIKLIDTPI